VGVSSSWAVAAGLVYATILFVGSLMVFSHVAAILPEDEILSTRPCIFPFYHNGVKYTSCTLGNSMVPSRDREWCAIHTVQQKMLPGAYAYCSEGEESKKIGTRTCVFPFIYEGLTFHHCTMYDHAVPWCALQVDDDGEYLRGAWGNCS